MKLKIDRFKDIQNRIPNFNSKHTDSSKLPNPFLRVLYLLSESDRPRNLVWATGGTGGASGSVILTQPTFSQLTVAANDTTTGITFNPTLYTNSW